MKKGLIIGAGNIGRGVVGYLLYQAGYDLSFSNLNTRKLIEMRNMGGYSVYNSKMQCTRIKKFNIVSSERLSKELFVHDLIFCCFYENAFKSVAEKIATVFLERRDNNFVNIMLCVNSIEATKIFTQYVEYELRKNKEALNYFRRFVGINQVMVLSAAMPLSDQNEDSDPYAILISDNPHLEIDGVSFKGSKPKISGIEFVNNAEARFYRKIYVGNMCHTMAAFIGKARNYKYIWESQQDPQIRSWIEGAFSEAHQAICLSYELDTEEDKEWVHYYYNKMNQCIDDPINRVVSNAKKKLGPAERFIGPAKLCLKHQIIPSFIIKGIAYGLKMIQKEENCTLDDLLIETCGLDSKSDSLLYQLIKEQSESI